MEIRWYVNMKYNPNNDSCYFLFIYFYFLCRSCVIIVENSIKGTNNTYNKFIVWRVDDRGVYFYLCILNMLCFVCNLVFLGRKNSTEEPLNYFFPGEFIAFFCAEVYLFCHSAKTAIHFIPVGWIIFKGFGFFVCNGIRRLTQNRIM